MCKKCNDTGFVEDVNMVTSPCTCGMVVSHEVKKSEPKKKSK